LLHTVIETSVFSSSAKEIGISEDEKHSLCVFLSQNPDAGDLMPGTGGARKLRIPLNGKGKSKGARVVTYFAGDDIPVFLLDVYSKGAKLNLTKAECNELQKILPKIADAYRDSQREKTRQIGSAS
jgi:hypothetical protein